MSDVLSTEIETYQAHKSKLLENNFGRYVLIKGESIVGIFDTEGEAIQQGYNEFGEVAYLVKKIARSDQKMYFTSWQIGD